MAAKKEKNLSSEKNLALCLETNNHDAGGVNEFALPCRTTGLLRQFELFIERSIEVGTFGLIRGPQQNTNYNPNQTPGLHAFSSSLQGAWQDEKPYRFIPGKRRVFTPDFKYPHNTRCNKNVHANGCIKNYMAVRNASNTEFEYIIDPWVPVGVTSSLLIKNVNPGRNYVESLEDSFQVGLASARSGVGEHNVPLSESQYLLFGLPVAALDPLVITDPIINEIKTKAKEYAISEKFFISTDVANLTAFADYVYEYHFKRPKLSATGKISYPLVGLLPYVDFITNGVVANLGDHNIDKVRVFTKTHIKYQQDYLNNLMLFANNETISVEKSKKLKIEIAHAEEELANLIEFDSHISISSGNQNAITGSIVNDSKLQAKKLSSVQNSFIGAIGSLKKNRDKQVKKLNSSTKAISSSSAISGKASNVASAAKSYADNNSSSSSQVSPGAEMGVKEIRNGEMGSLSGGKDVSYKMPSNDYSGLGMIGKHSLSKTGTSNKSTSDSDRDRDRDRDSGILENAIIARNNGNKEKYQSSEEQGIFEKITNAYIRNYDKVLSRNIEKVEVD